MYSVMTTYYNEVHLFIKTQWHGVFKIKLWYTNNVIIANHNIHVIVAHVHLNLANDVNA